ncbi:pimeloyl-ACP methyl ester carboxylesterase [Spirosoma oryzae]|uniref:Pimeloyl-ACP methyl ester carboxylesterase n=1 Tax=Spirosoma oryzae TaxID=1469603 RepID=A0A2T0T372_9BACT|nr:alpha/beta hydrolase [Spirosoma oryzae]PRY40107.1 pimeloyl-ACP methyl ester carboxylesterase [Spirosoma oryzae]
MNFIKVGTDASGNDIEVFYQDLGTGRPVVLIHGWPLSSQLWDYQLAELPKHNLRVIAYDRRGFGKSSQPWDGYNYDTFADDLKAVLDTLDLQNVTLVGMSMGGGEVARYMSRHGGARVSKVVFLSAITPYLLKTDDNPDGVDGDVFDDMKEKLTKDRADFLQTFGKQFYGMGFLDKPVSQAQLDGDFARAYAASQKATVDCVTAFAETDFRDDLAQIHVPTLIIHGDADKVVPIEASAERTAAALPNAEYIVYEGAPHGLVVSEKDRVIEDLLSFIQEGVSVREPIGTTTLY